MGAPGVQDATIDWLPLGSAAVIDWKQLGASASVRGAMAFGARIGGEPLLLRTWTNETTTYYEFHFLAYEDMSGTIVVSTERPEDTRIRLTATIDVEGRIGYSDISEFTQHARTGLYGSIVRTVDISNGDLKTDHLDSPTSAEAEIFEYAPESALLTNCGQWIGGLLDAVRAQLLDGEVAEDAGPAEPARPPRSAPPPPAKKRSSKRETVEAPPERPTPSPPKERAPPKRASIGNLFATTNSGDSWEVTEQETFLGRSKQCSIVLKSQRVSRKHASITKEDDGFYINDLGAANGIWAGTEKIDRERIVDGSEYIIGDVLVSFSLS